MTERPWDPAVECDWWNEPRMRAYRAWLWVFLRLGPLKRPVGFVWRGVAAAADRWRSR